jgi:hypothetical protein
MGPLPRRCLLRLRTKRLRDAATLALPSAAGACGGGSRCAKGSASLGSLTGFVMDWLGGFACVAALVFAVLEKLFRARRPIPLTARLDRGYLEGDGSIVLVELKTRWKDRAYLSDVIQLSAQKMAVEAQTGRHVAAHGFVTVQRPSHVGTSRSHKVELMPVSEIVSLYRRRQDVLAGRVALRQVPALIHVASGPPRGHGLLADGRRPARLPATIPTLKAETKPGQSAWSTRSMSSITWTL